MEEANLISALKQGDEAAFKQLIELYKDRVYNTCLGFLGNVEDGEDITQEVFIEAFHSINNFRGDAKLTTWLYRIASTKSLEHIRKQKRKKSWSLIQGTFTINDEDVGNKKAAFEHPGIKLENKERAAVLYKAIDKLPDHQRTAFTLHKIEDLSYKEIAEIMNVSLSSIESLMFRAKKNLQKYLTNYYKNT